MRHGLRRTLPDTEVPLTVSSIPTKTTRVSVNYLPHFTASTYWGIRSEGESALQSAMAPPGLIAFVVSLSMRLFFTAEASLWFQERAANDVQYFDTADEATRRYLEMLGLLEFVPMELAIAEQGLVANAQG